MIIECTLAYVTRKMNSPSGNPTKVLHTDHGSFVTAKDADITYAISDLWENKPVRITVDSHGRVVDLEPRCGCRVCNGTGQVGEMPNDCPECGTNLTHDHRE